MVPRSSVFCACLGWKLPHALLKLYKWEQGSPPAADNQCNSVPAAFPRPQLVVYLPTDLLPLPGLASPGPTPLNVKWALRKAVAGLALLVLLYSLASHRNYEREGCK